MQAVSTFKTARGWSWVLGTASLALPVALYAWQAHQFSQWAQAQGGFVCGLPLLGAIFLAALLSATLSLIALVFGIIGYRSLSCPRSAWRFLELFVVGLPALLAILALLGLVIPGL